LTEVRPAAPAASLSFSASFECGIPRAAGLCLS
jgi:hypothetical protein